MTYFQHGRRHHPRRGTDPIEGAGVENHFVQCSGGLVGLATDAGAPASPSPVGVEMSVDHQSAGSEDLFFVTAAAVDYLTIAEPGTYTVKAVITVAQGLSGFISVAGNIAGDAYLYTAVAPNYVPASYSGTGGGVMVWEQTIEVLSTAVVGTVHEVGVYPVVWQNSGSSRNVGAFIQVERLI